MLSIPPDDIPGADRHELLRLLNRRQHEINQLSDEWKSLSDKLVSVAAEKSEFKTRSVIGMSNVGRVLVLFTSSLSACSLPFTFIASKLVLFFSY